MAYLAQGELDLAKQALLIKIHLDPDAVGYVNLGDVYLDMGLVEEACHAYRQALDFPPDLMRAKNQLKQLECVNP
jgi:tetratricopeptide (TPR) repeat protein